MELIRTLHVGSGRDAGRRRTRARSAGFSLVEVLLGFALLLIIVGGLLRMFTFSIGQNMKGREASDLTNLGVTQLENIQQAPFNSWTLRVAAGNQSQAVDFWTNGTVDHIGDESWVAAVPAGEIAPWQRTTTIRQFGINGVQDNNLDGVVEVVVGLTDADYDGRFDNPLPAGTFPGAVHIRDIEVQLDGQREALAGASPSDLRLRTVKAL